MNSPPKIIGILLIALVSSHYVSAALYDFISCQDCPISDLEVKKPYYTIAERYDNTLLVRHLHQKKRKHDLRFPVNIKKNSKSKMNKGIGEDKTLLTKAKPLKKNTGNKNLCTEFSDYIEVAAGQSINHYVKSHHERIPLATIIAMNQHLLHDNGVARQSGTLCLPGKVPIPLTGLEKLKQYLGSGLYQSDWGPSLEGDYVASGYYQNFARNMINSKIRQNTLSYKIDDFTIMDLLMVNMDYGSASLDYVINDISEQAGISIIYDQSLSVTDSLVSIKNKTTSLSSALNMIIGSVAGTWVFKGDYIVISTPESINYSMFVTDRVYRPSYLEAAALFEVIPDHYSQYIRVGQQSNTIVISAPEAITKKIFSLVARLDKKPATIMLEAMVVDIEQKSEERLGIDWWDGGGISYSGKKVNIGIFGNSNGFDTDIHNQRSISDAAGATLLGSGGVGSFMAPMKLISESIKALSEQGLASILATPRVVTSSGKVATINISTMHVIPMSTGPKEYLQVVIKDYETGVTLKIKPTLTHNGDIQLDVYDAEVGTLLLTGSEQASDQRFPVLTTRNISTNISLSNGQMLAIGGLLDVSSIQQQKRMPGINGPINTGVDFNDKRVRSLLILIMPTVLDKSNAGDKVWKPIS